MADQVTREASAGAATIAAPQPKPAAAAKGGFWWGTGRRKTSIARVRVRNGEGKVLINGREYSDYFTQDRDRNAVMAPLTASEYQSRVDVFVRVQGGGFAGQAGAAMLGIARTLKTMDPTTEAALRDGGYLTRDARMTERKKYGRRGARRSFQFSKR